LIETAALSRVLKQHFVDDAEMIKILANETPLKRIKKRARDAKMRKGRFVD
jgi:hypothetical protein